MEKRLIKKVFDHDLLYSVHHVHYRDRNMRASAWADISKDLAVPAHQCKDMWRKLRNCYLNALNRRQNNKTIPKWKYETEMAFLLPYIDVRGSQQDMEHLSISYDTGSEIASFEPTSPRGESPEAIYPETSGMLVMPPKRGYPDEEDEDAQERKRFGQQQHNHQRHDEVEMFFLSVSETVKRLRPVEQARIKLQVCNLVYEAEIKMLEEIQEAEIT